MTKHAKKSANQYSVETINGELIACCNRMFANMTEFSQKSLGCRSLDDMIAVQSQTAQNMADMYFGNLAKLNHMLIDIWRSQTMEPLCDHTVSAARHWHKAKAA